MRNSSWWRRNARSSQPIPPRRSSELTAFYERKGLAPSRAREVAEQLTRHDALAAQLESEHGIEEVMPPTRPVVEGVTSGIAFALGAAIPLAITLAVSAAVEPGRSSSRRSPR